MILDLEKYKEIVFVDKITCDTPARAMIKCVKGHCGYSSCERCDTVGEYDRNSKQIFFATEGQLRTDDSFRAETDLNHHKNKSPFLKLPIDMLNAFPYDPMHLVYNGVMKRLLSYWESGPRSIRLSSSVILRMSQRLLTCAAYFTSDFARKPRSLEYLRLFKATEFRSFLLYTGCVIMRDICPTEVYNHFLLLHASIFILSDNVLCTEMNTAANQLLRCFVTQCQSIYGNSFLSYNVHALIHLSVDSLKFGPLDVFSAWKYENPLKSIKSMLRGRHLPLEQIERRLSENSQSLSFPKRDSIEFKMEHFEGPDRNLKGAKYKRAFVKVVLFACNSRDSCFMDFQDQYFRIYNIIVCRKNNITFVCKKYERVDNFYVTPVESKKLGIAKISELSDDLYPVSYRNVYRKCMILPCENCFTAFPLFCDFR